MPRVISGSAGGLHLLAPEGKGTRPTSDRVKEGLAGHPTRSLELSCKETGYDNTAGSHNGWEDDLGN